MKNWKSCLFAFLCLLAVAFGQSSGKLTVYDLEVKGTATGVGGATASSSLTDNVVSKTSPTVLAVAAGRFGFGSLSVAPVSAVGFTITSLSISTCSNESPIQCTVSSTTGTSLRNNDTVIVSGVGGNTAANGTWQVEVPNSTTIKLLGSTGNGSYTSGGTVAGSGSGTAYIYGTPQGYITIMAPSSAGLIMTCTGSCTMNQATSPDWPTEGGSVPLATVTITSGNWDSVTDARRFLNAGYSLQAGTGISIAPSGGEATVAVDSTVARTSGNNTYTGSNSFTAATRTAPHRAGTGSPNARDNCTTVGETYYQTDATPGSNTWGCTTTGTPGTWTLQGGGAGIADTFTSNGGTWVPFGTIFCSGCSTKTPTLANGEIFCVETMGGSPGGTPARINFFTDTNSFNVGWALYSSDGNTRIATSTASIGGSVAMVSQAFTPTLVAGTSYRLCYSGDGNIGIYTVDSSGSSLTSFFNTNATKPKMGKAANTVTWSAGTPTWPSTLGSITGASVGLPLVVITKN